MARGRLIWFIIIGLCLLGAVVYGFMPRPVPVDVVAVERGPLRVTVEEEGRTRVIDRFVLSAPVPGVARRIAWKVGDEVTAGQVLVQLEPLRSIVLDPRSEAEAKARVAAAKAALRGAQENASAAQADADFAAAELKRIRTLYEIGDVSNEQMDQAGTESRRAQAALKSSEFAVEVAQFDIEAAETALQYSAANDSEEPLQTVAIRAPVDGRILRLENKSERVVNPGEALLEIGDPQRLEVEVDVLSSDAVRMGPGTKVFYERWGGGPPLEGVVRIVEPAGFTKISALGVEEQRVLVIADITSPQEDWQRLGDGYRVEASFTLWENADVLQIPASALFRHTDGWAVFVVVNGVAERREVELGQRSGLAAEITNGLSAGDLVIPHPDDSIEHGTQVSTHTT